MLNTFADTDYPGCGRARIAGCRPEVPALIGELGRLIGHTPMIAIRLRYQGRDTTIYAKAEYYNLSGSIKDRMALQVLRAAYQSGGLKPGDLICEATSGNAGIAFCALGRSLGHPVRIYMPDWMSAERRALIAGYGAEICLVSKEEGGFSGSIAKAEELAGNTANVFLPRQFSNAENCNGHYRTTGPEILRQLGQLDLVPDALIAGVGTGGTIMGAGAYLKTQVPGVKLHPLEPAESPTLTTGHKVGHHRIQGVSDEFIPPIVRLDQLDGIVCVHDGDAILMAQKLSRELGLAVGISSGANVVGALKVQRELGPDAVVATVLSDDNKKYLSTDLVGIEPPKPGYLAPDVELLDFRAIAA
ncbi:MAG: PLP-dependent cysteine synthase family protein [Fimbriimonadaceae bacterium]|nr:PLP-dependent cysteine synthase family protein [Alphaproteobacteria bacterium]